MNPKTTTKVLFDDKCIMQIDFSVFSSQMESDAYEKAMKSFFEFISWLKDVAEAETEQYKKFQKQIDDLWHGNEDLRILGNSISSELGLGQYGEIYKKMEDILPIEKYKIWETLYIKENEIECNMDDTLSQENHIIFEEPNGKRSDYPLSF